MPTSDNRTLKTPVTTLKIIDLLRELNGARITELSQELDIAPSSVHRHLATLLDEGYVVKEGDEYDLGLRFLRLGEYVRNRREEYITIEEYTAMLAEETDCRAVFLVEEYGEGVYIHTAAGKHGVWTSSTVGKRVPLYATAAGKAVLASLPETRRQEIIDAGLDRETENTITDPEQLRTELEEIREHNYSFNNEEQISGVRAVGAPVFAPNNQVFGAFSVAGPAHRMQGDYFEDELPKTVLGVANECELRLSLS